MKIAIKLLLTVSIILGIGYFSLTSFFWFIDNISFATSSGRSMEPTLKSGEKNIVILRNAEIKENDIISFSCPTNKCSANSETNKNGIIKRVIKIDKDGNFWVEGDNKEHSTDSRSFGWLSPSDIDLDGKVIFPF